MKLITYIFSVDFLAFSLFYLFILLAILEEKNESLKDAHSCKVCTKREATILFLPCGHVATCHFCVPAFGQCLICNTQIKATARTLLA
jgi:baculoviral IAP repeat-containing protein 2/3